MSKALVIHGGPILTMDPENPMVNAVAIDHGVVIALGSERDVRTRVGPGAEHIHLDGRMATPGLYDAHAHTFMTGFSLGEVDVSSTAVASITGIARSVRHRAVQTEHGVWIIGQGYDQASLDEQRHPNRH
ncbi:MAG: amidohydrolase family protein, partial [Thermomicrobiales bacterium]